MAPKLGRSFNAQTKLIALSEYLDILRSEAEAMTRPKVPQNIQARMLSDVPDALGALAIGDPDGAERLFRQVRNTNGDSTSGIWAVPKALPDGMSFAEVYEASRHDHPPGDVYVTGRTLRAIAPHIAKGLKQDFHAGVFGVAADEAFAALNATAIRLSADVRRQDPALVQTLRPLKASDYTMWRQVG